MLAKKTISIFTKITGYKRLIKCKGCGKKAFSEIKYIYCKEFSKKIKNG